MSSNRTHCHHNIVPVAYHIRKIPPPKISKKRFIISVIICVGLIFYTQTLLTQSTSTISKSDDDNDNDLDSHLHQLHKKDQFYFIDTPGCKMPRFQVHGEFVNKFLLKMDQIQCKIEPPITETDQYFLWIKLDEADLKKYYNVINVEDLLCYYRTFRRLDNDHVEYYGKPRNIIKMMEKIRIKNEYIHVDCNNHGEHIYQNYHFFVQTIDKPKVMENDTNRMNDNYNVLIIGLDSVSRSNFQRQLGKSYETILKRLNGFEFSGYNKLYDNTYPNLIPALTGHTQHELDRECLPFPTKTPFDNCSSIIWNRYKKKDYYTVYAEDAEYLGLFSFQRGGFNVQPTDYYMRPFIREMELRIAHKSTINVNLCFGYQRPIDYLFKYIEYTTRTLNESSYFSFFWSTTMTHDDFSRTASIDDDLNNLLIGMDEQQLLTKTIVILMSDHGIRIGDFRNTYQGMMEERQPFLFMVLPKSFRDKYSTAVENLKLNKFRLTTHFDLHETLKDLADIESIVPQRLMERKIELTMNLEKIPRGISLFLPIPDTRTCYQAGITSHWCTCFEMKQIALDDKKVISSANFMIDAMNNNLNAFPLCEPLKLLQIDKAILHKTKNVIIKSLKSSTYLDITVLIMATPGNGSFEATLRWNSNSEKMHLTGSISRTNLYGNQSHCIDDVSLKLYCFCKNYVQN